MKPLGWADHTASLRRGGQDGQNQAKRERPHRGLDAREYWRAPVGAEKCLLTSPFIGLPIECSSLSALEAHRRPPDARPAGGGRGLARHAAGDWCGIDGQELHSVECGGPRLPWAKTDSLIRRGGRIPEIPLFKRGIVWSWPYPVTLAARRL